MRMNSRVDGEGDEEVGGKEEMEGKGRWERKVIKKREGVIKVRN